LKKCLVKLFEKYPYAVKNDSEKIEGNSVQRNPAPLVLDKNAKTEWVEIGYAEGKICAASCGLFPPCTPLILPGERVTKEKLDLLKKADNVFGVNENRILVLKEEE
jgi:arginine/lysine/ornithine decarboxylase